MRSPKDMQIIQIEITNACVFTCSNCTRMCGHHEKTFMMDFETFQRAVDSLEGYEGSVSLMGGEPTLHPEFERFSLYLKSKYEHLYEEEQDRELLQPMDDFVKTVQDVQLKYACSHQLEDGSDMAMIPVPCLYSMMGKTYLKHFELIQDVFKRQVLNDHSNEMFHQPALISRKDLGIPDEQWIKQRNNCWIQNTWSASITPKGAFFCEIAAALDMLLQGPGGWPIEKDWWKRKPEDFEDQLHWCELCGFACETFTRDANESIDDVSETLYEKLKQVHSPKVKAGKVNVIKIENGVIAEESKASEFTYSLQDLETGAPYIKYLAEKVNTEKAITHPQSLVAVVEIFQDTTKETMTQWLTQSEALFDEIIALCHSAQVEQLWKEVSQHLDESISHLVGDSVYGKVLENLLLQVKKESYILAMSVETQLTGTFIKKFKESTPNTGTLIYAQWQTGDAVPKDWVHVTGDKAYVGIFHQNASSFRAIGFDRRVKLQSFDTFAGLWYEKKRIVLDSHLFVYSSKEVIKEGERCAIFGGGGRASDIYFLILQQKGTCVAVVDSNPRKQGRAFEHLLIQAPECLKELQDSIDSVLIGSPIYYEEMKDKLLECGFPMEKIKKI